MQMWRSPGGNVANEEGRALTAVCVRGVVQRRHDWHAADRADTTRTRRGGEDSINETRCPMRFECGEMGVEIHPFSLPLLLINVRDPHQRGTSLLERSENLRHEQVRDHAGVERTWTEHDQVSLLNRRNR